MNREDFEIFKDGIIYLDNAATTMKPNVVVNSVVDYYTKYTANAHRGDYDNSLKVDNEYEGAREKVRKFINADSVNEVIFTKGSTESFNMIVFGFMSGFLKKDDEVILNKGEHASNILPWLALSKKIGFKVKYAKLNDNYELSVESIENEITPKTKVISLAHITNAIGDIRDIEKVGNICKEKDILFVLDATQSIGHIKMDVKKYNVSFMGFSAHKMLGPTGVGVLYGKEKYLNLVKPLIEGGGMNAFFDSLGNIEYKELPEKLEAGTQNLAGIFGFGEAINYINKVGIDNIHKKEIELKKYMIDKMSKLKNITIYNKDIENGIVTFNVEGVFAQDVAAYLNKSGICVRVGNHCAKILSEVLGVKNTCRASMYFYNTKEDIDKLVEKLDNDNILYESL